MSMKKGRVLLVDDEPHILTALEFLVETAGYQVRKAAEGEEALRLAADFLPDIIVLDVMMPGMDGFELARHIRQMPELEDARIVFLTAKGTVQDRAQGYSSGGEVYLTKPFDNDQLLTIINEVLEFG
jgi:DNA-binding response OmpR family regulator